MPRYIPWPVDAPNSLGLFRHRRDFGVTALVLAIAAASAAALSAASIAVVGSVQTAQALNNLSAAVATALDTQSSINSHLAGGIMLLNQRVDLVQEQVDSPVQLAQLGCEQRLSGLCITSVPYSNLSRAANLSKELSRLLSGSWSANFSQLATQLRLEITHINSTRLDPMLTDGLLPTFLSMLHRVREWAGLGSLGLLGICGFGLMLCLLRRLRWQQQRDRVVMAQAFAAVQEGSAPGVWLSMLQ
uniref:Retroviral envelope protein GP41-like domain-containing protein n=1 Tax=Prolemur simus TaxID=1328070 RepID=A0A8C8YLC1_PROSS